MSSYKILDFRVISGGTENHLSLSMTNAHVENGKVAQNLLDQHWL